MNESDMVTDHYATIGMIYGADVCFVTTNA